MEDKLVRCPDCNSVLGEINGGVFVRTRAGGIEIWGENIRIVLTCHNESALHPHTRMILVQEKDNFKSLPYEQYLRTQAFSKQN